MSQIPGLSAHDLQLQSKKLPVASVHNSKDAAELKKAAIEFESYFMDMVMQTMRSTVDESNTFGDSQQTKLFQGMLDTEFSKISSKRGNLGLAEAIIRQMTPPELEPKKSLKVQE